MGKNTKIQWCRHTFNGWFGCTKVSEACVRCYAESFADGRLGLGVWGKNAPRKFFGEAHWNEPLKWDVEAGKAGKRHRVFCASMADVFEDRRDLDPWRVKLWNLIARTPNLDWLLLTKRPENMVAFTPEAWREGWPANVWAGTTVENQKWVDVRVPIILTVPARVRFLSVEPLLENVTIPLDGISWAIVGCESGTGARPMDRNWARSVRDQCRAAGTKFFFKQAMYRGKIIGLPKLDGKVWKEVPTTPHTEPVKA